MSHHHVSTSTLFTSLLSFQRILSKIVTTLRKFQKEQTKTKREKRKKKRKDPGSRSWRVPVPVDDALQPTKRRRRRRCYSWLGLAASLAPIPNSNLIIALIQLGSDRRPEGRGTFGGKTGCAAVERA